MPMPDRDLVARMQDRAVLLDNGAESYGPLLDWIGDRRIVCIGEGSHGTHEFYHERAEITKRLIREKGFSAVAIEGDWPDTERAHRYATGVVEDEGDAAGRSSRAARPAAHDVTALDALGGFQRFPQWMWRNAVVVDFLDWLRIHNDSVDARHHVDLRGIDLYSLYGSIDAVLGYLERTDPEAAKRARYRYGCFEHFGEDPQAYGYAASFDLGRSCEDMVVTQLVELRRRAVDVAARDGAADAIFSAEQNARLVKNAEEYYRSMFRGRASSWNLRDCHMADTVDALLAHLARRGRESKVVIWAHNSHLGDARATEMGWRDGEWNVGQLMRERHAGEVFLVGQTTHTGTVTCADDWDEPTKRKAVRPSLPDSYERLLHDVGIPCFMLRLDEEGPLGDALAEPRLERAIGVIYRPETERLSHYFQALLSQQFDAVLHFDETTAVEPVESAAVRGSMEPEETYPTGM